MVVDEDIVRDSVILCAVSGQQSGPRQTSRENRLEVVVRAGLYLRSEDTGSWPTYFPYIFIVLLLHHSYFDRLHHPSHGYYHARHLILAYHNESSGRRDTRV